MANSESGKFSLRELHQIARTKEAEFVGLLNMGKLAHYLSEIKRTLIGMNRHKGVFYPDEVMNTKVFDSIEQVQAEPLLRDDVKKKPAAINKDTGPLRPIGEGFDLRDRAGLEKLATVSHKEAAARTANATGEHRVLSEDYLKLIKKWSSQYELFDKRSTELSLLKDGVAYAGFDTALFILTKYLESKVEESKTHVVKETGLLDFNYMMEYTSQLTEGKNLDDFLGFLSVLLKNYVVNPFSVTGKSGEGAKQQPMSESEKKKMVEEVTKNFIWLLRLPTANNEQSMPQGQLPPDFVETVTSGKIFTPIERKQQGVGLLGKNKQASIQQ